MLFDKQKIPTNHCAQLYVSLNAIPCENALQQRVLCMISTYPLVGSNTIDEGFCTSCNIMLQYCIVLVHINIKPGSLLKKYQFPVIQSRRNLSIAMNERKYNEQNKTTTKKSD